MKKVIIFGMVVSYAFSVQAETITNTGKSFLRYESPFQSGSPERISDFAAPEFRSKHRAKHNGEVEFIVFGGKNASQGLAGQYYAPATSNGIITFNASVDAQNNGTNTLQTYWSGAQDLTFAAGSVTPANFSGAGIGAAGFIGTQNGSSIAGTLATPSTAAGVYLTATTTGGNGVITTPAINGTVSAPLAYGNTFGASPFAVTAGQVLLNNNTTTVNESQNQFALATTANQTAFLPYNLTTLQAFVDTDAAIGNFNLDTNRNTAIVRPWNFGIGYAPNVQMGQSVNESAFVSTIRPELERSQWGIGACWKQLLSEKDTGFWLEVSTALQRVTMNMNLNEDVLTPLVANPYIGEDITTSQETWVNSWSNGNEDAGVGYATADITTIAQAFAQENWNYGKIAGAQSITRLADIELKLGYQFVCEDNVLSNGYVGMVIPTGNKATAEYMAEPIVGNGFHFGLMAGSTAEIQLNAGMDTRWSTRSDVCYRYLFQNTQVRSFDTNNGDWSRYMYVWQDYAAEQENETVALSTSMRQYTPGINVFTQEVKVTPQAQIRYNQALILESGGFKGEMGWNVLIRQDELVSLVNAWDDNAVVYADASNNTYSLYNANRTIYNDAYQSSPIAQLVPDDASLARYNAASVQASDLNLNSAASWSTMVNTPYLVLGYAFNEERSSVFSIGGSYEFTASNDYINDWMLWGKFSFTF